MARRLSAGHRSAPRWSNSISSRFMRPRGCSTRARGSPNVILSSATCWRPSPDSIHPVTREITAAGARLTAADTFASLYRLQALRRVAERSFRQFRRDGAADGADRLFDRAGAGQSGRAQLQARHLHQFCESARPLRAGAAGRDARGRHSVRHHAAGARGARRNARQHRAGVPCRHQTEDGSQGPDAARRSLRCRLRPAATKSPSPWSARISPAWRSTANCRRSADA